MTSLVCNLSVGSTVSILCHGNKECCPLKRRDRFKVVIDIWQYRAVIVVVQNENLKRKSTCTPFFVHEVLKIAYPSRTRVTHEPKHSLTHSRVSVALWRRIAVRNSDIWGTIPRGYSKYFCLFLTRRKSSFSSLDFSLNTFFYLFASLCSNVRHELSVQPCKTVSHLNYFPHAYSFFI